MFYRIKCLITSSCSRANPREDTMGPLPSPAPGVIRRMHICDCQMGVGLWIHSSLKSIL